MFAEKREGQNHIARKKIVILVIFLVFIFQGYSLNRASAVDLSTMSPGTWMEAPNTPLDSVLPNPIPPGSSGPDAIIGAWNGGAYDTKRDRLIVWGGGHQDYGGNEIYLFDVNTLTWSRPWGPSPNIPAPGASCGNETYSDGNPVSRHTYDGLQYLPNVDKFFSQGGARYCASGSNSPATWVFDFNTPAWTRKSDSPVDNGIGRYPIYASAYDGGLVYIRGFSNFSTYNPTNDTWIYKGSVGGGGDYLYGSAAIDPINRLFIEIGQGSFRVWNIDSGQLLNVTSTGGSAVINAMGPGFAYDSVDKKLIAWIGGSSVYTLDVTKWTWTENKADSSSAIPTSPAGAGSYGRFRYIPSKNVFIVVNGIHENVWFYKFSPGSGPLPDTTPPAPPKNPIVK